MTHDSYDACNVYNSVCVFDNSVQLSQTASLPNNMIVMEI